MEREKPKFALGLYIIPEYVETDLKKIETLIRGIEMEELVWDASEFIDIAYGIQKLLIKCTIGETNGIADVIIDKISEFDGVRTIDIASYNKIQ